MSTACEANDHWVAIPCGHVFHHGCLETSLEHRSECPSCRVSESALVGKPVSVCLQGSLTWALVIYSYYKIRVEHVNVVEMQVRVRNGRSRNEIIKLFVSAPDDLLHETNDPNDDDDGSLDAELTKIMEGDGAMERKAAGRIRQLEAQLSFANGRLVEARQEGQRLRNELGLQKEALEEEISNHQRLQDFIAVNEERLNENIRSNVKLTKKCEDLKKKERWLQNQLDTKEKILAWLRPAIDVELCEESLKEAILKMSEMGTFVPNFFYRIMNDRNKALSFLRKQKRDLEKELEEKNIDLEQAQLQIEQLRKELECNTARERYSREDIMQKRAEMSGKYWDCEISREKRNENASKRWLSTKKNTTQGTIPGRQTLPTELWESEFPFTKSNSVRTSKLQDLGTSRGIPFNSDSDQTESKDYVLLEPVEQNVSSDILDLLPENDTKIMSNDKNVANCQNSDFCSKIQPDQEEIILDSEEEMEENNKNDENTDPIASGKKMSDQVHHGDVCVATSDGPSSSHRHSAQLSSMRETCSQGTRAGALMYAGPSKLSHRGAPGPSFIKEDRLATMGLQDGASLIHHGPDGRGGIATSYRRNKGNNSKTVQSSFSSMKSSISLGSRKSIQKKVTSGLKSTSTVGKNHTKSWKNDVSNGLKIKHFYS